MAGIRFHTAQNVTIDHKVASIGDRIAATLIDQLILIAYIIIVLMSIGIFSFSPGPFLFLFITSPVFLYHLVCEVAFQGQSVGKMTLGTKVVKLDGSTPSLGSYLLRWILRVVDSLFLWMVGVITFIFNEKGQRLGDMAAGTTVVKIRRSASLNDTLLADVDPGHVVTFPGAADLSDKDIGIIREFLEHAQRTNDTKRLVPLAEKVKKTLKVQSNMGAYQFLHTVLKDHVNSQYQD